MNKKIICCVHDKKADVFEGFMIYNNASEAVRSFEMTCNQNDTFKKWPEDFQFVLVGMINFENGEINAQNEITKKGQILDVFKNNVVLAEAKDFIKHEGTPKKN